MINKIDAILYLENFLTTMQGEKRSILDYVHMCWGGDFCILFGGMHVSCLDFLLIIVVISSLVIWIGSASGLAMHPDEAEIWQTQLDHSLIVLIASSCTLVLSIIVNNCCMEKYSSWYKCCRRKLQDNSVYPEV